MRNTTLLLILTLPLLLFSQKKEITGTIVDNSDFPTAFATVGLIKNKLIGTYSNEDGQFTLIIDKRDQLDSISVSSIGFKTKKVSIVDFLKLKDHKIIVEEAVTKLEELTIVSPKQQAYKALKNLKKTTLRKTHQINALYRVTTTEDNKAKHFVEYYVKIKSKGPAYLNEFISYDFTEKRESMDYRSIKTDLSHQHFLNIITFNILKDKRTFKKLKWKKEGHTTFDGEDVVILNNRKGTKIYVGLNNYSIYRIQKGDLTYIYKKDSTGKLYLAYHKRKWDGFEQNENSNRVRSGKRVEFITLDIITNKDKMEHIRTNDPVAIVSSFNNNINFSSQNNINSSNNQNIDYNAVRAEETKYFNNIKYNVDFWNELQTPPETKFFKKIKKELEEISGITFKEQLKLMNKSKK